MKKTIVRWNPIREMNSFWNTFDRLMDERGMSFDEPAARHWGLAVDVMENEDAYVLQASIPGVNPEDIDVTLEDNVLQIAAETRMDETIKSEEYRLRERRFGSFSRSLRFPVDINPEAIDAKYENGVLTLTVPKAEEVKPKKIAVSIHS
jgi:HSP20 family protein